jgi:TPR repeat protein
MLFSAHAVAQSADLLAKANAGDIDSQLKVAYNYQFGIEGPKDIPRALEWLRKAGALGSAEALFRLGMLAYNGDVLGDAVEENQSTAWACFEGAAVLGHPDAARERDRIGQELNPVKLEKAQLAAARLFMEGTMAPKNVEFARSELMAGSNAKSPIAGYLLGMTYLDPPLGATDADKAIEYCTPAEKQRAASAAYCLGKAYELKADDKSAFKHFEIAARAGVRAAMLNIAKRYHEGRGAKQNEIMAAVWAMNARGFGDANDLFQTLTANFTPKQIKEVNKKSAELGGPGLPLQYKGAK